MTPSQLDHLRKIDAHLARLLDIASKRTPGRWLPDSEEGLVTFVSHESELGFDTTPIAEVSLWANIDEPDESYTKGQQEAVANAAFIASCAGNAEAGWKATRAAIADWLSLYNSTEGYADGAPDATSHDKLCNEFASICRINLQHILAAFPLETLTPEKS